MLCETNDTSIVSVSIKNCLIAVAAATISAISATVGNGFEGRKRSKKGRIRCDE